MYLTRKNCINNPGSVISDPENPQKKFSLEKISLRNGNLPLVTDVRTDFRFEEGAPSSNVRRFEEGEFVVCRTICQHVWRGYRASCIIIIDVLILLFDNLLVKFFISKIITFVIHALGLATRGTGKFYVLLIFFETKKTKIFKCEFWEIIGSFDGE